MRVLVTGGAGYIGSVVVEELLSDGHEVIVFDNLSKGHRASVAAKAEFITGDLLNQELLTDTLKIGHVDAVIHMAADSLVIETVVHPAQYYRNNVVGGRSRLESMRKAKGQGRVFSSRPPV